MDIQEVEVIPGPGVLTDKNIVIERVGLVAPYVEWVQIDIADNKLVPNKTFLDPSGLERLMAFPVRYELHMMTENPSVLSYPWVDMGFKRLIWHIEAFSTQKDKAHLSTQIHNFQSRGVEVGLAVDMDTPADRIFPYLDTIDCVLVMTIKAGFSGQSFVPDLLDKVKEIKAKKFGLPIEVDGGINFDTAALSVDAGVTRLVSTSTLYNADNIKAAIEKMRGTA